MEKDQIPRMVLPHTTSKLRFSSLEFIAYFKMSENGDTRNTSDLESLTTYGFRGEALSSLCAVANVTIVSRTARAVLSNRAVFSAGAEAGLETAEQCAGRPGTIVTADNLFCTVPVRRNFYRNQSRRREELDRVKRIVQAFAIVNHEVRFSLYHDKVNLWSSVAGDTLLDTVALVIGRSQAKGLESFRSFLDPATGDLVASETGLLVSGLLPVLQPGVESQLGRCSRDLTWVFVNRRPVEFREVERLAKEMFMAACGLEAARYPVCCVVVEVSGPVMDKLDPNLEPNKQRVGLACKEAVLTGLRTILQSHWQLQQGEDKENTELGDESNLDDTYGKQLQEPSPEVAEVAETEAVAREPCFTHIGSTQRGSQATTKISAAKFVENKYGLSQYFSPVQKLEEKNANFEDEGIENGFSPSSSTEEPSPHSPVLKEAMFLSPDLPGVDAVYVNRLKDGDFPEHSVAEEVEDDVDDRSDKPRNPFIQYECEDDGEDSSSENDNSFSHDNAENSVNMSAPENSHEVSKDIPQLKLHQPKVGKLTKATPVKRKYEFDKSVTKIDTFLDSRKVKMRKTECEDEKTARDRERKRKIQNRRKVNISFNKEKCARKFDDEERIDDVVAPWKSGWIVKDGSELFLLHPPGLRQAVLLERLLAGHKLPCEPRASPLQLQLSPDLAQAAAQLQTSGGRVTDQRVAGNGFQVAAAGTSLTLESWCPLLPELGVPDLMEVLASIRDDAEVGLRGCRPARVRDYLAGEAARLRRDMPANYDRDTVAELLGSGRAILGRAARSGGDGATFMVPLKWNMNPFFE